MAEWIINRGLAGFPELVVEADVLYIEKEGVKLTDHKADVVCVIALTPGLTVIKKNVLKT